MKGIGWEFCGYQWGKYIIPSFPKIMDAYLLQKKSITHICHFSRPWAPTSILFWDHQGRVIFKKWQLCIISQSLEGLLILFVGHRPFGSFYHLLPVYLCRTPFCWFLIPNCGTNNSVNCRIESNISHRDFLWKRFLPSTATTPRHHLFIC